MLRILILLIGFGQFTVNAQEKSAASPSDKSPVYHTSRDMLEALRDKLESSGITTAKGDLEKYLAVFGDSSEKAEKVRKIVHGINTTDLPPVAKKLEELKLKQAALEKDYTDGKITKEAYDSGDAELKTIRDQVAKFRATINEKDKELAPLTKALDESQAKLSAARGLLKDAQDKIMLAAGQALAQLSLQQTMDQVKLEGLAAQDKLDLIDSVLADTVLETYVKGKFQKMFTKDNLCPELAKCSGYNQPATKPELKGVFPGRKTH